MVQAQSLHHLRLNQGSEIVNTIIMNRLHYLLQIISIRESVFSVSYMCTLCGI